MRGGGVKPGSQLNSAVRPRAPGRPVAEPTQTVCAAGVGAGGATYSDRGGATRRLAPTLCGSLTRPNIKLTGPAAMPTRDNIKTVSRTNQTTWPGPVQRPVRRWASEGAIDSYFARFSVITWVKDCGPVLNSVGRCLPTFSARPGSA